MTTAGPDRPEAAQTSAVICLVRSGRSSCVSAAAFAAMLAETSFGTRAASSA